MKSIILNTKTTYAIKSLPTEKIIILEIQSGVVALKNMQTQDIFMKTVNWCEKNLIVYGKKVN